MAYSWRGFVVMRVVSVVEMLRGWFVLGYISFVMAFALNPVTAPKASAAPCDDFQKTVLGVPTWYKYLQGDDSSGTCRPVIRNEDTIQGDISQENINNFVPIALAILEIAITLGGIIAFIMIIWASFNFVLSLGEPDKATSARKMIQNALIGLVIMVLSTRVISFIGNRLTG